MDGAVVALVEVQAVVDGAQYDAPVDAVDDRHVTSEPVQVDFVHQVPEIKF